MVTERTDEDAESAGPPLTGCPCGCRTRLPWLDDPDCVRHQPYTFDYGLYDRAKRYLTLVVDR